MQDFSPSTPAGGTLVRTESMGPLDLRGFGRVSAQGWLWKTATGQITLVRFVGQDAEAARIIASKYREDLLAYGAVTSVDTPKGLGGTALEVRHSGVWLLGMDG
ncbi:MAG TPA: hypothetical protein VGM23_18290, partial [Armatimonadota bacterium]